MTQNKMIPRPVAYAMFGLTGCLFVFFCLTGRDLAARGNILWTVGYVFRILGVRRSSGGAYMYDISPGDATVGIYVRFFSPGDAVVWDQVCDFTSGAAVFGACAGDLRPGSAADGKGECGLREGAIRTEIRDQLRTQDRFPVRAQDRRLFRAQFRPHAPGMASRISGLLSRHMRL